MIQVYIVVSGSGEIHNWRQVSSLEEATEAVAWLDTAFLIWEAAGFPVTPDLPPAVQFYEGCDVYASDTMDGPVFFFTEDNEWEAL